MYGIREMAGQQQCVYIVLDRITMEIHFSFKFVFLYAFPLALMGTLCNLIGRKLWFRTIPDIIHSIHRQAAELSKRRIIHMLIIVIATFALCWLPVHVFHMLVAFTHNLTRNMASYWPPLIVFIGHANSALNPCLEIALNRKFRAEFFKFLATCRTFSMRCFRKRSERRGFIDSQRNLSRIESVENIKDRIAMQRGRLYDLSNQGQTLHSCPIFLVRFSYCNNVETES